MLIGSNLNAWPDREAKFVMVTPGLLWEEFEFAADAWQWLDDNGFVQSLLDHLQFSHPDGRTATLILPEGETGGEPTEIKIFI